MHVQCARIKLLYTSQLFVSTKGHEQNKLEVHCGTTGVSLWACFFGGGAGDLLHVPDFPLRNCTDINPTNKISPRNANRQNPFGGP